MTGKEAKQRIKDNGFYQWQVALHAHISESTLIRWLRSESALTHEQEIHITQALNELIEQKIHNLTGQKD